ncbi:MULTISPECIES: hypothetical protein [unclassified Crossiella]|uniref:hypothetical protein n=1 Tax=unclassified Crossiella TaxID=2620835 RepID=UPI001FFE85EC|nr:MULTISPECIES: hypothetical protein [unclassified Crossiella]MCK2240018.1 hypothetical protein [Crossiella sp. S99.2]MCK2252726.1 hypothetical protein [Crossiella sp. S99.1]
MATTVGIPAAQDSRGHTHPRAAIDRTPSPYEPYRPLHCAECTTPVVPVGSYARRTAGGGREQVSAYYRLAASSEHDTGCRYDFPRRAEELIHESHGTLSKKNGLYELRLPDPDAIEDLQNLPPNMAGKPIARLHVTTTPHALVPALGSAAQIVKLLRDFDNDPTAVAQFRVRHAGQLLTWSQFCRPAAQSCAITIDRPQRALLEPHPLAIHGTVRATGTTRNSTSYRLLDTHRGHIDTPHGSRRLHVLMRSSTAATFGHLQPGDHWLGYGRWKIWVPSDTPYAEIQLWVDGPWSLAAWRD